MITVVQWVHYIVLGWKNNGFLDDFLILFFDRNVYKKGFYHFCNWLVEMDQPIKLQI
jgi:hypothetical protein